jgi:death-on-curing protein
MPVGRKEPAWLGRFVIDAIQVEQLKEHGGLHGIRDENALESALARARNKWVYGKEIDLAVLAAAYGFALVANHPYFDGNKRIGFLALVTFLGINGHRFHATDEEVVTEMLKLAGGQLSEKELAEWIRLHMNR